MPLNDDQLFSIENELTTFRQKVMNMDFDILNLCFAFKKEVKKTIIRYVGKAVIMVYLNIRSPNVCKWNSSLLTILIIFIVLTEHTMRINAINYLSVAPKLN